MENQEKIKILEELLQEAKKINKDSSKTIYICHICKKEERFINGCKPIALNFNSRVEFLIELNILKAAKELGLLDYTGWKTGKLGTVLGAFHFKDINSNNTLDPHIYNQKKIEVLALALDLTKQNK